MHTLKGIFQFFAVFLAFFCQLTWASGRVDYEFFIGSDGDYYLKTDKIVLILHGEVATPLEVYPHNGLLRLYQSNSGVWVSEAISESQLPSVLNPASNHLVDYGDVDGDGVSDVFIQGKGYSDESFLLTQVGGSVKVTLLGWEASLDANAKLEDVNGDGRKDIVGDTVLLATTDGRFVNTGKLSSVTDATLVGATSGNFSVSESGAATYSLPINLPAGTAGVQPELAFTYNSQAPSGPMGVGWNLSGASAIVRCPQNIATDGRTGKVSFSDEDRFCLNGQKLVPNGQENNLLVSDVDYHDADTYHTEIESFATVTKQGVAGLHGPRAFKVETKSGETHYYGDVSAFGKSYSSSSGSSSSDDAFVEPGGSKSNGSLLYARNALARVWALKAIEDVKGNYIVFEYNEDQRYGEHYLKAVHYTGTKHSAPTNKVEINHVGGFVGQSELKIKSGYVAGSQILNSQRIQNVKVYDNGEIFRHYKLNYSIAAKIELKDTLRSIQECTDEDGESCLSPLTLSWSQPSSSSLYKPVQPESSSDTLIDKAVNPYTSQLLDFNGDGKVDLLFTKKVGTGVNYNSWVVHFDVNSGNHSSGSEGLVILGGASNAQYVLNIDYDGDGTRDLITKKDGMWTAITYKRGVQSIEDCRWEPVYYSSPVQVCDKTPQTSNGEEDVLDISGISSNTAIGFEGKAQIVDFNGDGLEDILFQNGQYLELYRNGYLDEAGKFEYVPKLVDLTKVNLADADTVTDYGVTMGDTVVSQTASMKSASMSDLNGDGKTDLVIKLSRKVRICQSAFGGPFQPCTAEQAKSLTSGYYQGSVRSQQQYSWVALVADENSFALASEIEAWKTQLTISNLRFVDFNGDGLTDIVYKKSSKWHYRIQKGDGQYAAERNTGFATGSQEAINITQFADLNADGIADILYGDTSKSWIHYLGKPTSDPSLINFANRGSSSFSKSPKLVRFVDLEGDARLDLLVVLSDSTGWQALRNKRKYTSTNTAPDYVVTDFSTNAGLKTHIDYDNIINSSVYTYRDSQVAKSADNQTSRDVFSPLGSLYVVSRTTSKAGSDIGGNALSLGIKYQYGGAAVHKKGRGNLGFESVNSIDEQTGIHTTTVYSQKFPYVGMPLTTVQSKSSVSIVYQNGQPSDAVQSNILSKAVNTLAKKCSPNGGCFPYVSNTTEYAGQIKSDGRYAQISKVITSNVHDDWGNLTSNTTETYAGYAGERLLTVTTTNEFNGAGGAAAKGRLSSTSVTKKRGIDSITRNSNFSYYSDGMLKSSTVEPGSAYELKTTYTYDSFGNQTSQTISDVTAGVSRTTKQEFDSIGRLLVSKTNALGESENYLYNGKSADSLSGRVWSTTVTGPNKISTTQHFDQLGQTVLSSRADGTTTSTEFTPFSFGGWRNPTNSVITRSSGKPTQIVKIDVYGNQVYKATQSLGGGYSQVSSEFDRYGRVTKVSNPYFGAAATQFTEYEYDKYGRVIKETYPNGEFAKRSYDGLVTAHTDPLGQVRKETKNALGELVKVQQGLNTLEYSYDPYGNLTKVENTAVDSKGTVKTQTISTVYNKYGHKEKTIDPDKGTWSYQYNAFGELISQSSANQGANKTELKYDALGRLIWRYEPKYGDSPATTACWVYGKNANVNQRAVGKLLQQRKFNRHVSAETCASASSPVWQEAYLYDSLGRISKTITSFNGKSFVQEQSYDAYSRVAKTTYPEGLVVSHGYSAEGIPLKWTQGSRLLRQINEVNAAGKVTQETVGNGVSTQRDYYTDTGYLQSITTKNTAGGTLHTLAYSYNELGSVINRDHQFENANNNFAEVFTYDEFNRIENRSVDSAGASVAGGASNFEISENFSYDGFGNITNKAGRCYKYDAGNQNRLVSIHENSSCTGAEYRSFGTPGQPGYDANGNVLYDGHRMLHYTAFDKPWRITKGSNVSEFSYAPSRGRYLRKDNVQEQNPTTGTNYTGLTNYTTHYVGAYELIERSGGAGNKTEHKYHIAGAVISNVEGGSSQLHYLHRDHQGSVTSITDANGAVVQQFYYDTWGKQYQVQLSTSLGALLARSGKVNGISQSITTRGYTGHEQLTGVGLTHMNGRIYDADIGRFLQADPHVQAPNNAQNYNRYSYVLNNPMSYTDPSGYFFSGLKKFFKKYWKVVAAAVVSIVTYGAAAKWAAMWAYSAFASSTAQLVTGVVAGAISGAAGGLVATGSLRGAAYGALSGAVFGGIGASFKASSGVMQQGGVGHVAAHASAGGVLSKLQGGSFGHGFLNAGVMKGVGMVNSSGSDNLPSITGRTVIQAVAGGTLSRITGGKFANGAITSAIQYVVNERSSFVRSMKSFGESIRNFGSEFGVGSRYKTGTMSRQVDADQYLANEVGVSKADYTVTTGEEVAKALSYGGLVLTTAGTGTAVYAGWAALGGAAWLDSSLPNILGAFLGPVGRVVGPIDDVIYSGVKPLEQTIKNVGHVNDSVTIYCDLSSNCKSEN
ncbi:hypothetical protein AAOGI_41360 [Agarivorans albus]